jgi:hypothetical protein
MVSVISGVAVITYGVWVFSSIVGGGMVGVKVGSLVLVALGVEVLPQDVKSSNKTNPNNILTDNRRGG